MRKRQALTQRVAEEIRSGVHGEHGCVFMSVRGFASRYDTCLATAHKVISDLKSLGMLAGATGRTPTVWRKVSDARSGSRQIGVIVTSYLSTFFGRLIHKVRQAAEEKGYTILTGSTEHEVSRERQAVTNLLNVGVAGLIVTPGLGAESKTLYRELAARGVALVLVGREIEGVNVDCITADHFTGGVIVARHFVEMGYDSFAYIGFGPRLKMDMRLNGFRSGLYSEGFELPREHIVDDNGWDVGNGYRAVTKLLSLPNRPRAIMAFNDLPAIGALQYCQEQGIAVPGEVALAGFDNLAESRVTRPPLTTVEHPHTEMAQLAVQALLDRIRSAGERIGACRRLRPRLVVRESSDGNAVHTPSERQTAGGYAGWL